VGIVRRAAQDRLASEELGHDAAERPRVRRRVVVGLPQEDLRRGVAMGTSTAVRRGLGHDVASPRLHILMLMRSPQTRTVVVADAAGGGTGGVLGGLIVGGAGRSTGSSSEGRAAGCGQVAALAGGRGRGGVGKGNRDSGVRSRACLMVRVNLWYKRVEPFGPK
jgi:hypothetical protein